MAATSTEQVCHGILAVHEGSQADLGILSGSSRILLLTVGLQLLQVLLSLWDFCHPVHWPIYGVLIIVCCAFEGLHIFIVSPFCLSLAEPEMELACLDNTESCILEILKLTSLRGFARSCSVVSRITI